MRVEVLIPDAPAREPAPTQDVGGFAQALDALSALLNDANREEDAFAAGHTSLQDAVYERARADVALSVATAAAARAVQAAQSVFNMQV